MDDIQTTVMGFREVLMNYFKGDCVQSLVRRNGIEVTDVISTQPFEHNYQRDRFRNERQSIVWLDDIPLMKLKSEPNVVVFHSDILGRSKELRAVKKELKSFFKAYLPYVKLKEQKGTVDYGA